jgi:tetratricopeptide (TPR) repeat protein
MMRTGIVLALSAGLLLGAEKPVELLRGMGLHKHPIATRAPEAQEFFNQGMVLLYGFNRYEAQRSFRKAAELDPEAIMPRVGIAATYAPHINMDLDGDVDLKKACAAAKEAAARKGPAAEMDYAKAAMGLCSSGEAYSAGLGELHKKYPDDPDAASLYAESLMVPVRWKWWVDGKPNTGMAECIRTLENVIKRDVEHPGANHFYVHAMEMSPNPEYALPSAQRLMGGIAPNAGHLVHMAGHIYMRIGDYEVVASSNERAVQADEHYFHKTGVQGGYMGYYAHNLHFLVAARMMQGRMEEAYTAAVKMAKVGEPMLEEAAGFFEAIVPTPWFVLVRFREWDRMLNEKLVDHPKLPVTRAAWHWARAMAYQGKGDLTNARKEQQEFERRRKAVAPEAIWINNKASDVLQLASHVLAARMGGDDVEQYRRAIAIQDGLIYDEPPPWFYPVRESLGAALLRKGDAKGAEMVFREDLDKTPRNGRTLFGLMKALEAQGRKADAQWVRIEFDRAWKKAQVELRMEDL